MGRARRMEWSFSRMRIRAGKECLQLPVMWIVLLSAALSSSIGGIILCLRAWSSEGLLKMLASGAGLLLGIVFLDLMPHLVLSYGRQLIPFLLVGYVLFYMVESFSHSRDKARPPGMAGILSGFLLHSFLEGASLLNGFSLGADVGVPILFALILHKIPDGAAAAAVVLALTGSRQQAFWASASLGAATLVGALGMGTAKDVIPAGVSPVLFALATGIFLYLCASHLVPMLQREGDPRLGNWLAGAILVYLLAHVLLHANHQA